MNAEQLQRENAQLRFQIELLKKRQEIQKKRIRECLQDVLTETSALQEEYSKLQSQVINLKKELLFRDHPPGSHMSIIVGSRMSSLVNK